MDSKKRILIIDDRLLSIQGLKQILNNTFKKNNNLDIYIAPEYIKAIDLLKKIKEKEIFIDIIVLNIDINYGNSYGLVFAEDYINKIKRIITNVKIIISTCRNEEYRINRIIRDNNPFGIIIENKTSENELCKLFFNVFNYKAYFPKIIISIINKYRQSYIELDEIDYHILYFLRMGIKSNCLQNYIPLSNSAIEKRKYKLKDEYSYKKCSDEQLVKEAIKRDIL